MNHRNQLIDLIERARDARPYCSCGAHTVTVVRDAIVWLDCSTLADRPRGTIRRVLHDLAPHVREAVVDLGEVRTAA